MKLDKIFTIEKEGGKENSTRLKNMVTNRLCEQLCLSIISEININMYLWKFTGMEDSATGDIIN